MPDAWPTGAFRGLRARGGFEIDLEWTAHGIIRAEVRSLLGNPVRIRTPHPAHVEGADADRPEHASRSVLRHPPQRPVPARPGHHVTAPSAPAHRHRGRLTGGRRPRCRRVGPRQPGRVRRQAVSDEPPHVGRCVGRVGRNRYRRTACR
uniref:glycoside hydrolase family 95-like protein n=1 Tax=Streptomyces parvulus TaxID=146923 RepID=UPI003F5699DA